MQHIQFEYDINYHGGDYDKVGQFALVPVKLCEELGDEAAFHKHTGVDPKHIIHFSPDELYDENGDEIDN